MHIKNRLIHSIHYKNIKNPNFFCYPYKEVNFNI